MRLGDPIDAIVYHAGMAISELPTINDFLARLYSIRDDSGVRAREAAKAITARNAARGLLRSGATLLALAELIEGEFDDAVTQMLAVLRHMQSVPEIDYQVCRDQAFLRARDLIPILRGACSLEKWFDTIGRGVAIDVIDGRVEALFKKIEYRFRQFDIGLDQAGVAKRDLMTPTATRLQLRLSDRHAWFQNEWFFKWHHIGGESPVEIDRFDGRRAIYSGIRFSGSPRDIYWQAIASGLRREIVDQFGWVEDAVNGSDQGITRQAIDQCSRLLVGFAGSIRRKAIEKDRILRGDGMNFPVEQDLGRWDGSRDQDVADQADALKAALFPASASPRFELRSAGSNPTGQGGSRPFQVALSFAGEQRSYVREVASALAARHVAVFYDEFQANELWGKDGAEHFHQIYSRDAQYVVMFISAEYVDKAWTRHERRSAISRQMTDESEYILPVRFDDAEVPGLPSTLQYLLADRFTPAALALEIARKVGVPPMSGKASDVPPPASGSMSGEVTFDYGAFDGRYVIGNGATAFETCWSKVSGTGIHLSNDPPSIQGVAVARGATEIAQIGDAAVYDFTSRVRMVRVGEIAVLRNANDFYAAIKVLRIEDDSEGATSDALTIRYVILPGGGRTFGSPTDDPASP
jgi:hypothetical protein